MKSLLAFIVLSVSTGLAASNSPAVLWKRALDYSLKGQNAQAIDVLQELLDSDQEEIGEDLLLLTAARVFYQSGKLDQAIKYYSQIPTKSEFWIVAKEETAWALTRKQEYSKALAELKTVTLPMFAHQVGAEPYFQQTLINLRICDYSGVLKSISQFKENFGGRIPQLDQLAKDGHNSALPGALAKIEAGIWDPGKMKVNLKFLPRQFHRDAILRQIGQEKASPQKTARLKARFQALAKMEVEELSTLIRKFKIAEVEASQRMNMGHAYVNAPKEDDSGKLVFRESTEIWLDEIDSYKVKAKTCEPLTGKKL